MREPIRDKGRLEHMMEAIDRLLDNTKGLTLDNIRSNDIFYFGLVKNIEIIGEAAYKLTEQFKKNHPETPWRQIVDMRHVLVHGYYQIKEREVFYVIEDNLPQLREQVARYLAETDWAAWEGQDFLPNAD